MDNILLVLYMAKFFRIKYYRIVYFTKKGALAPFLLFIY